MSSLRRPSGIGVSAGHGSSATKIVMLVTSDKLEQKAMLDASELI